MANNQDFPNSGAMFSRQKRSQNSPDMGGDFTIDGEVLDYVLKCYERREPVKLEINGWRRSARNGGAFLSVKVDIPWQVKKQSAPQPVAPPKPYPQRQQQTYGQASRGDYRQDIRPPLGNYPQGAQNRNVQHDMPFDDRIPFGNDDDSDAPPF